MQRVIYRGKPLPYFLYHPDNIIPSKKYPLIIYLHGVGERGNDLISLEKYCLPKYLAAGLELFSFVYTPQCPINLRWENISEDLIFELDQIIESFPVNSLQVSLTGFSMGGQGTWQLAVKYTERFVKIAPVAGRIPGEAEFMKKVCLLRDKPVWVFHSDGDTEVEVGNSDNIVEALRNCKAKHLKYTRYKNSDHGETADKTYLNAKLYKWLLHSS